MEHRRIGAMLAICAAMGASPIGMRMMPLVQDDPFPSRCKGRTWPNQWWVTHARRVAKRRRKAARAKRQKAYGGQ